MRVRHYEHPQQVVRDIGAGFVAVEWSMMAEHTEMPDGTRAPREWMYFDFTGPADAPYYLIEFEIGEDRVPRVGTVMACSREGGREVRASDLRQLRPLEDLLEESFDMVTHHPATTPATDFVAMDVERRRTLRSVRKQARRRFTDDTAERVAGVYVANLATGAPTKAVRDTFGIADSTASLYVKRARPLIDRLLAERDDGDR